METKPSASGLHTDSANELHWLARALGVRHERETGSVHIPAPRNSLRRHIDLKALINFGVSYSVSWRVRDLSLIGAFIQIKSPSLLPRSQVELVLHYAHDDRPMELRIPAAVTRVESDGAALMFGDYDDQTYTDLVNLLYLIA